MAKMIYSVLDGINEYAYNSESNRLRGCVNDANNLLARWKPDSHILLTDKKATKQNIMAAWREMRDKCVPGDVLRLSQSSHGMEEGLCCYNLSVKNNNWNPDGYISYHEIAEFTAEIPESILVEILIDACHCERKLRGLGRVYGKAKYMQLLAEDALTVPVVKVVKPTSVRLNVVLWAACEPNQTSADAYIDKQPQGAFTAAYLKFDRPGRIRSDVIYYARKWLGENGYEQVPHLYTSHDHAMEVVA
jgi:hypothetical protein